MKQIKKYSLFFILIYTSAYSQNTNTYSLKQCVETGITNNLQVKQSDLLVQDADINLRQARSSQLPDLFANLNQGINQGRSIDPFTNSYLNQSIVYGNYNLSTSITLFNGLQLKNLIRQNALTHEATKWDLQAVKENLTLNIILAYLQVLNNEDQLQQSKDRVELTKKQAERLEVMNKEGAIVPSQLYEMRGQLSSDQVSVINNENALQSSKLTLSQLMNIPFDKNMEVEKLTADNYAVMYASEPEVIYQASISNLALVKAVEFRTKSSDKAIQVARGQAFPRLGLGGNLNTNYSNAARTNILLNTTQVPSGDYVTFNGSQLPVITTKSNYNEQKINYFNQFTNNYNTSVFLNVRIPILNAYRTKNDVALAKNNFKKDQYTEQLTKTQLRQSIEQAYINMTSAFKKYQALQQQVADFTEAFRGAEARFNAGATTQIDYLIAKNNLDKSQIDLISARYDYIFQTRILDFYQGKLLL